MNAIVEILMERDGMSQEDAQDLFKEAQDEAHILIDDEGSLEDLENILKNYFCLEPDYLFDLIEL
jgi:hypothetical protein